MATLLSDGPAGSKSMNVGKPHTRFTDLLGNRTDAVITNSSGWGDFPVNGGSVSVWVQDATTPSSPSVHFTCNNGTTVTGQNVYVVGNVAALGSWNTANAVQLSPTAYPAWSGAIANLPSSTQIEWKCIKKQGSWVVWQSGANNVFTTPQNGWTTASGSF